MFERTDPKTLMRWLILGAVVYFLLPFDLIPDFLGIPGRIDDVLAIVFFVWFYRSHLRQFIANRPHGEPADRSADSASGPESSDPPKTGEPFDAHRVLGITPAASDDAIRDAYRARMREYHPDKVAHLGEELQKLAHEKSQEIQRAYRQLHR